LKVLSENNSNKIEDSQKTSKTLSSENDIDPENIIRTGLKNWVKAWQSRNVALYLSFYSKDFKDHKRSRPKWEAYRRQSLNNSSNISIKITDIKTQASNNMVIRVTFIQRFKSDTTSDIGMKELTWAKEDGNWKIIKETWEPQY
jgi:ketosteroid isomerase-like protein